MTSSSVSDLTAPVVAEVQPAAPAPPGQKLKGNGRFGALLQEATVTNGNQKATSAPAKAVDAKSEGEDQKISEGDDSADGKEKKRTDAGTDAIPLICFCPLPNIEPPEPVKTPAGGSNTTDSKGEQVAGSNASVPQTTPQASTAPTVAFCGETTPPIVVPNQNVDQETAAQSVGEPKAAHTPNPPKSSRLAKSPGGIELDRKLFEPILPEPVATPDPAKSVLSKGIEPPAPHVANASHGTLVAKMENNVKSTDKSAEIAPAIEQKMPGREVLRRTVDELARVESFLADKQGSHLLIPDFDIAPAETVPVKSLEAAHLIESIRTEVTSLRQRGDNMVTVVLRPDSGTQLSVDISISRNGSVHAVARCERGDFQSLQNQWPQLQQSLAAHGIKVADLSNQNGAQQQDHRSANGAFQNFERGESKSKQRDQHDTPSFEEQIAFSKTKLSVNKTQPQPARTASATRRWQSWA